MVCAKCEKKLTKLTVPDKWKDGANNTTVGTSKGADRKLGENKLLSKKRVTAKYNPYTTNATKCLTCKAKCHQNGAIYCHGCAYKEGKCAMCGVAILDTKKYKMSAK